MPTCRRTQKPNGRIFLTTIIMMIVVCMMVVALPDEAVNAQGESPWAPDQRIPGYLDDTLTPVLLADNNGMVHAFASQRSEEGGPIGVVYRKWALKKGWTSPVDILLAPFGDTAVQSAFLDANGIIHLVFYGSDLGGSSIYYSNAPVEAAELSQAWATPLVIGDSAIEPSFAAISGNGAGSLVMIYAGNIDGNGIYSTISSDSGVTWSKPIPVFLLDNPDLFPFILRLCPGQDGVFHAAWGVVTSLGVDTAVHYARFDLKTLQWTTPVTLAERYQGPSDYFGPSYPSIIDSGKEVIVVYNNGNPLPAQRAGLGRPVQMVRLSKDNGITWEPPTVPFIRHEGDSGEHVLVQDSDQVVHALFVQRTAGGEEVLDGIWQSDYKNGFWSDPFRFIPTYSAADLRAAIVQGNVLLMVWRLDPGEGKKGIWYSYKILSSRATLLESYPTRQSDIVSTSNLIVGLVPTITRTPPPPELLEKPIIDAVNPAATLGFATIIVMIILITVIVLFGVLRKRQH